MCPCPSAHVPHTDTQARTHTRLLAQAIMPSSSHSHAHACASDYAIKLALTHACASDYASKLALTHACASDFANVAAQHPRLSLRPCAVCCSLVWPSHGSCATPHLLIWLSLCSACVRVCMRLCASPSSWCRPGHDLVATPASSSAVSVLGTGPRWPSWST